MPLVMKKPVKAKKEAETKNERLENTAFKTGVFGFKRTQVNLFINSLKKQIRALEKEKENLIIESGTIDGSERQRLTEQFERQILDLSEKLNSEKNTSAMLEKECMRLQGEIENLNIRLVKKGGGDVSEAGDINITKAYLSSSLTKKLNKINEEISKIKSEFMIDENELIISIPEDKPSYPGDFGGMKYDYPAENKKSETESLPSTDINNGYVNENNSGQIRDVKDFYGIIPAEAGFAPFAEEINDEHISTDIAKFTVDTDIGQFAIDTDIAQYTADTGIGQFAADTDIAQSNAGTETEPADKAEESGFLVKEKKKAVEIMPSTKLYEQSANSFDEVLMNSDKVEKDDDFADILFQKSSEFKFKGDDLIAVNPETRDYGDDLIAGNPATVDKGEDLSSDIYGLYINDSNIMIDDDNKFYSGEYDEEEYENSSPDVSKLGFIGINEVPESKNKKALARANRRKNIADDIEMSSSMDISDFLI